jgi:hypothetical protein
MGEATESIAFARPLTFFIGFQPKNRMSSPKTTQPISLQQDTLGI